MSRGDGKRRERLLGPAPYAALVAAAAAGLLALHAETRGGWRGRGEPASDGVALAYLRALVDRNPQDPELRLRLARRELALGSTADAERTLAPLLAARSPVTDEADLLAVHVAVAAWRAAPQGSPERADALARAHRRLGLACERSEAAHALARLAALARELGRPDLAARAGERAAGLDPAGCARHLSRAAQDLLAAGEPGAAAETYERAFGCAADPGEALALGLDTLDAYRAADRGADALRLADALAGRFPADPIVLHRAEGVARERSDAARARRFGARLVELGAADAGLLRRQLDLDLAAGDLEHAALVADRLFRQAPQDPATRLTAAGVATWAGHPSRALRHWIWLARRGVPGSAAQALAIARARRDDTALAEVLTLESLARPLPSASLAELAEALERLGPAERAIAALEDHAARHPASRDAWEALAALHERRGDLSAALATREALVRRFGPGPEASIPVARLQQALGRPGAALAELRRWEGSAEPARVVYWQLLGELAWGSGSDEVAARAYRTLRDGGRIDVLGMERLILLSRRAGRTDDAIRYGREGWLVAREPRFLLLAMDEAAAAGRWRELSRLAAVAKGAEPAFARFAGYWMLRARLAEKEGRPARAAELHRRALAVDPTSAAARSGLIWLLVATRERGALSRQLAAWREEAEHDPGLWRAYAAGLEALGRRREALTFHERVARADPGDGAARERWLAALRARDERPAARLAAEAGVQSFGPLRLRRFATSARSGVRGAEVELRVGVTRFASREGSPRLGGDETEVSTSVVMPVLGGRTELSAGLGARGREVLPAGGLAYGRAFTRSVEGRLEGAFNERALESAALLAEGVRHRAGGAFTAGGRVAYGRAAADWRRWTTRGGTWLAGGASGSVELGVRAHAADAEVRVGLRGEHQRNDVAADLPPRISVLTEGGPLLPPRLSVVGLGAAVSRWRLGPARLSTEGWLGWMSPPRRAAYRLQAGLTLAPTRGTELSVAGFAANDRWDLGRAGLGVTVSIAQHLHR